MCQISERVARVLNDVGEHGDVERAVRQIDGTDRSLPHALRSEPLVRRAYLTGRVFHAGHVVPAVSRFQKQIA